MNGNSPIVTNAELNAKIAKDSEQLAAEQKDKQLKDAWMAQAAAAAGYSGTAPAPAPVHVVPANAPAPPPPHLPADNPFAQGASAAGIAPPSTVAPNLMLASGASTNAPPIVVPGVQPAPPKPPPTEALGPPNPAAGGAALPAEEPPPPPAITFQQVSGGGMTPAREAPTRGPIANAALLSGIESERQAVQHQDFRTQLQAEREGLMYEKQAADFAHQQEVAQATLAKRQVELDGLKSDYEQTAARLGEMKLDNNRTWGSMSTFEKIGTVLLLMAAGGGGANNNVVWHALQTNMNEDIEAQKFAYKAGLDQLNASKTAFELAMAKYQNEDAAEAVVRAAQLDVVKSRIAAMSANWKGTDAANHADDLRAKIDVERAKQIETGFKFVPPSLAPKKFTMQINGIDIPGTMTEDKAQSAALEYGVKHAQTVENELVKGGVAANAERVKAEAAMTKDQRELWIPTGNGRGYLVPSKEEAVKHREGRAANQEVRDGINRMLELRKEMGFTGRVANWGGIPSTDAARITVQSKALIGAINRQQKFGALDVGTQQILDAMQGNPLAVLNFDEAFLEEIRRNTFMGDQRFEQSATGGVSATSAAPKSANQGWDFKAAHAAGVPPKKPAEKK